MMRFVFLLLVFLVSPACADGETWTATGETGILQYGDMAGFYSEKQRLIDSNCLGDPECRVISEVVSDYPPEQCQKTFVHHLTGTDRHFKYTRCKFYSITVDPNGESETFYMRLDEVAYYRASDPPPPPPPPAPSCPDRTLGPFDGCYIGSGTFCLDGCSYSVGEVSAGSGYTLTLFDGEPRSCTPTTGFTRACGVDGGTGTGDGDDDDGGGGGEPGACPPGQSPGNVNGETVCVDAGGGDDDGGGGPPKPGGGGHMVHNGPYACVSVSEPYIDGSDAPPASGIDCVFCGVPGMPPCSVAIREFDQLKQPLEQLAANGDASKALLEEIRDAIRNRGIGGGGGNGGNGGNGGSGPGGNGPGGDGSGSGGDGDGDGDGNAEEQPEKEEECPPGSDRAACATLGDVDEGDGDGDEPPEHEITYKAENLFSGGASCPANVVSMVNGVSTVLFDWQLACRYITGYMRPILLVLAAMTALLIVVPRS